MTPKTFVAEIITRDPNNVPITTGYFVVEALDIATACSTITKALRSGQSILNVRQDDQYHIIRTA